MTIKNICAKMDADNDTLTIRLIKILYRIIKHAIGLFEAEFPSILRKK